MKSSAYKTQCEWSREVVKLTLKNKELEASNELLESVIEDLKESIEMISTVETVTPSKIAGLKKGPSGDNNKFYPTRKQTLGDPHD